MEIRETSRCAWAQGQSEAMRRYHDEEWGRPSRDARHLFEMLILEGAQAGLSWSTILHKREGYRAVFDGFDPERIAAYTDAHLERLREDARIVRNRLKIQATRTNARCFLALAEREDPARFFWQFVDDRPQLNHWRRMDEVPARTPQSDALSRELRRLGFTFVGSTICYAFMQSVGMVNDHTTDCFRHSGSEAEKADQLG